MSGLLDPILKDTVIGSAEVRKIFELSKGAPVAGCMVTTGRIVKGKVRVRRRKHDDARLGLGEQRDVGRKLAAARDDAGQRLGSQPPVYPPLAPLSLAEHAAVAFGAKRPGAGEDGVDLLAQTMEHGAVAVVSEAARAALERGPPVDAGDEVDHRVRAPIRDLETGGERCQQRLDVDRGRLG